MCQHCTNSFLNIGVHFMCSMPAMSVNVNVQKGIRLLNLKHTRSMGLSFGQMAFRDVICLKEGPILHIPKWFLVGLTFSLWSVGYQAPPAKCDIFCRNAHC